MRSSNWDEEAPGPREKSEELKVDSVLTPRAAAAEIKGDETDMASIRPSEGAQARAERLPAASHRASRCPAQNQTVCAESFPSQSRGRYDLNCVTHEGLQTRCGVPGGVWRIYLADMALIRRAEDEIKVAGRPPCGMRGAPVATREGSREIVSTDASARRTRQGLRGSRGEVGLPLSMDSGGLGLP